MTDQFFGSVQEDMDPFKKILAKIPGFKGYIERQARRDSDKLLRDTIADRYEKEWQRISTLQVEFITQGEITYVDDLERAAIKLRTFVDRIRRAARGHSSLFEAVKINERELEKLYQHDVALLDLADEVSRAIDNVETSVGSEGLPAALRHLTSISQSAIEAFNLRESAVLDETPAEQE
jgi:hypothetical protein